MKIEKPTPDLARAVSPDAYSSNRGGAITTPHARTPTQQPGIAAAGPGDGRLAKLAARLRYAPPATQLGRETSYALTFQPDQSTGAGQHRRGPYHG